MKPIFDSSGARVRHYSLGPAKAKRTNNDPEHQFQVQVAAALEWAMPDWPWTSDASGVRVGMQTAKKMKEAGVKRGNPDIRILFPSAVTRYVELKADGSLSKEQKEFRDFCIATGRDIWAMARTLDQVQAILLRWKVPLKMPLAYADRYRAPVWGRMSEAERRGAWR